MGKTQKQEIKELFDKLNLPIKECDWNEKENGFQILNGAAYILFNENDEVSGFHGGYE